MPQTVKTPRIYINVPEYLATTGTAIDPLFRTLPIESTEISSEDAYEIPLFIGLNYTNPYLAILGHNLSDQTLNIANGNTIINGDNNGAFVNGFSIMETGSSSIYDGFSLVGDTATVGSIVTGTYYDFPHSADLNLTLEYSYEGIKEITTKGGSTLTNQFYNKPPYNWELGNKVGNKHSKSGRRIWSLSFSFLSSNSVFPNNSALDNNDKPLTTTDTLLDNDSLQRVVHLLNGFQNSFIFSPDNTSTQQDNFAICKIEANSFRLSQQAPNLYTTSMKIKEVW